MDISLRMIRWSWVEPLEGLVDGDKFVVVISLGELDPDFIIWTDWGVDFTNFRNMIVERYSKQILEYMQTVDWLIQINVVGFRQVDTGTKLLCKNCWTGRIKATTHWVYWTYNVVRWVQYKSSTLRSIAFEIIRMGIVGNLRCQGRRRCRKYCSADATTASSHRNWPWGIKHAGRQPRPRTYGFWRRTDVRQEDMDNIFRRLFGRTRTRQHNLWGIIGFPGRP